VLLENLDPEDPWEILVFRERQVQEDFLDFLDCQDHLVCQDPREIEESKETLVHLEWEWRDPWAHRDLMVCLDHLASVSLVLKDYGDLLASKDCEEWLEDLAPLDPLDIASFVKHSGCRLMLGDKRKDEHDTTDLIAKFQGYRFLTISEKFEGEIYSLRGKAFLLKYTFTAGVVTFCARFFHLHFVIYSISIVTNFCMHLHNFNFNIPSLFITTNLCFSNKIS